MIKKLSLAFSAGALGGFFNAVFFWFFGVSGIAALLGMNARITWDPAHIYWGVTWGGIWGILFLVPLLEDSVVLRGVLFSLCPTLVALFVVFPLKGMGIMGLNATKFMPLIAFVLNAIWGIAAAIWMIEAEHPRKDTDNEIKNAYLPSL